MKGFHQPFYKCTTPIELAIAIAELDRILWFRPILPDFERGGAGALNRGKLLRREIFGIGDVEWINIRLGRAVQSSAFAVSRTQSVGEFSIPHHPQWAAVGAEDLPLAEL